MVLLFRFFLFCQEDLFFANKTGIFFQFSRYNICTLSTVFYRCGIIPLPLMGIVMRSVVIFFGSWESLHVILEGNVEKSEDVFCLSLEILYLFGPNCICQNCRRLCSVLITPDRKYKIFQAIFINQVGTIYFEDFGKWKNE